MVDLLEGALPPPKRGGPAPEREHRRAVEASLSEWAHRVGDARPRGDRAYPQRTSKPRPAFRGEGRTLFVARVDDADAVLMTAVQDRKDVAAGQREEMIDTERLQRFGDGQPAVALLTHGG